MISKKKETNISQTNRADSAPQEPKSALRGLMQRLSLTLLACTLTIGVTEAQQVAPPISGVIGKHCCPAKVSGGPSNQLKISMITHG